MANAERVQVDSVCNGLCGKYAQPSGRKVVVAVAARSLSLFWVLDFTVHMLWSCSYTA